MSKSLAKELAANGILVNATTPVAAETYIFKQKSEQHIAFVLIKIPMNRFAKPPDIGSMVALPESDECSFSTGAVFDLSGGRATY